MMHLRAKLYCMWPGIFWGVCCTCHSCSSFHLSLSPHILLNKLRNVELIDNVLQHFCLSYSKYFISKIPTFQHVYIFYFFVILRSPTYYLLLLFIVKHCFKIEKISFPSFRHPYLQTYVTLHHYLKTNLAIIQRKVTAFMVSEFFCILKSKLINSARVRMLETGCIGLNPRSMLTGYMPLGRSLTSLFFNFLTCKMGVIIVHAT